MAENPGVGPMGYDKFIEGLRCPPEVDPYYAKSGPLSILKCCRTGEESCWYCITNDYVIQDKTIIINGAGCDWYRDGTTTTGGRIKAENQEFLENCPLYSPVCL